jgi:hypothetical protein
MLKKEEKNYCINCEHVNQNILSQAYFITNYLSVMEEARHGNVHQQQNIHRGGFRAFKEQKLR